MGLTNFNFGSSSFGIPILGSGGIPVSTGNHWFVNYGSGSDGNNGKSPQQPFKTIPKANDMAVTNNNDVIILFGNSTHVLTSLLTVSKNRLTFIGIDGSYGRRYGQNAKVSIGVTTAATDIATILNLGIRNNFINIKFINSNTVDESLYCFADGGEYTTMDYCELYKSTDLDQTGAAELVCNGDSSHYRNFNVPIHSSFGLNRITHGFDFSNNFMS